MRSAGIPLVLLFLALGLALSFAAPRVRTLSVFALIAAVAAFSLVPVSRSWLEGLFLGCWGSIIATGATVHMRRSLPPVFAIGLAVNAAAWASGVATVTGSRLSLFEALPCVLILIPASWLTARHTSIPAKVLSSWVIAVAVLAATLQWLPVTPGYLPDHME